MSFTLKQVRYFVSVAAFGTVSRAAQELAMSQRAIKDLEQRLGVKPFERRSRGPETTYQGHVFLSHAKSILAEASSAETLSDPTPIPQGTRLNVGVTSLTAGYVLSEILDRFRRACPGIEVNAVEDTCEYLEHLIVGGEIDIAVMVVSDLQNPDALHSEVLAVSPFRLWLPMGHRLCALDSIAPDDLRHEPQILLDLDEMQAETLRLTSIYRSNIV